MSLYSQVENIVYLKHTSTSAESPYVENSNRPDSLLNIMRDAIIVWQSEPPEENFVARPVKK